MNGLQVRRAPLTPNLEDYKQKNKSKSKRKHCNLPPTNPPTPKIHRAHLHLKANIETKEQSVFCSLHPDQPATHHLDPHSRHKFCTRCAILQN